MSISIPVTPLGHTHAPVHFLINDKKEICIDGWVAVFSEKDENNMRQIFGLTNILKVVFVHKHTPLIQCYTMGARLHLYSFRCILCAELVSFWVLNDI